MPVEHKKDYGVRTVHELSRRLSEQSYPTVSACRKLDRLAIPWNRWASVCMRRDSTTHGGNLLWMNHKMSALWNCHWRKYELNSLLFCRSSKTDVFFHSLQTIANIWNHRLWTKILRNELNNFFKYSFFFRKYSSLFFILSRNLFVQKWGWVYRGEKNCFLKQLVSLKQSECNFQWNTCAHNCVDGNEGEKGWFEISIDVVASLLLAGLSEEFHSMIMALDNSKNRNVDGFCAKSITSGSLTQCGREEEKSAASEEILQAPSWPANAIRTEFPETEK